MKRTDKRSFLLIIPAVLIIYGGLRLYRDPIDTYTWTELLINYAAGFMRRGLIGKIGYWVSPYISVKFFLSALITVGYLLHLILYARLARNIEFYEWLLFAFSPTAFLFPIYDFSAFGRKDVFLIFIFLFVFQLIQRRTAWKILLPLMLILYQTGILIHEYALFYFPFAVVLILICYRDRSEQEKVLLAFLAGFFILVNLYWIYALSKRYYNLDLIPASWVGLIPAYNLTPQSGAFGWLGVPLKEGLQPVFDKLSYPQTFFSYLFALLLSLFPLLLLNARYQISAAVRHSLTTRWINVLILLLFLFTTAIFIFSSDWGRLIYLYGFNLFPGLVVVKDCLGCTDQTQNEKALRSEYALLGAGLLFLLFSGTWFVKQYVDGGNIALQQGLIFQILDWIR